MKFSAITFWESNIITLILQINLLGSCHLEKGHHIAHHLSSWCLHMSPLVLSSMRSLRVILIYACGGSASWTLHNQSLTRESTSSPRKSWQLLSEASTCLLNMWRVLKAIWSYSLMILPSAVAMSAVKLLLFVIRQVSQPFFRCWPHWKRSHQGKFINNVPLLMRSLELTWIWDWNKFLPS